VVDGHKNGNNPDGPTITDHSALESQRDLIEPFRSAEETEKALASGGASGSTSGSVAGGASGGASRRLGRRLG